MISYDRLLFQLVKRRMSKEKMRVAIGASPATMAKLTKNEHVSLDVIERICAFLHCRIEDVIEYIPDDADGKE